MRFPILRQYALHRRAPLLRQIGMRLLVTVIQSIPIGLLFCSAIDGCAKMLQGFVGNVELFVFGPAQVTLGFSDCVFPRRITMRLACTGSRHTVSDYCL